MKDLLEMRPFALHYLRAKHPGMKLNRSLNYLLCHAAERLVQTFGEFTRKDIAMLIEAWVMAQGTEARHAQALKEQSNG